MVELGCTPSNLANIFPHKSTIAKFYPFTENNKVLLQKTDEDMAGGPTFMFRRKAVVDETLVHDSIKKCKTIVGSDGSQLCFYGMCQAMPSGLYTEWELDSEFGKFKPLKTEKEF